LVIQHAVRMRRLILSSVACVGPKYLPQLSHKRDDFWKQRNMYKIESKMCFDFLYKFCFKHFSFWEEFSQILSQMYIGLHVQYRCYCCQIVMKRESSRQTFNKSSNIKLHKNTSSGSWVIPHGRTDRQTFRSRISQFFERPKKFYVLSTPCIYVFCVDLRTNSHYFPIRH